MRDKIIQEYTKTMDDLHFSTDTKESLTHMLMAGAGKQQPKNGTRKFLLVALIAATVLVTMTGAAVYTRWSNSAQAKYSATEQQKAQAENMGLSSMLETSTKESEVISATDQGVTITAVQTIVDKYSAMITLRIEGFDLPEGEKPSLSIFSAHVTGAHTVLAPGYFYDGTIVNNQGELVYLDGSPVQYDSDGNVIPDYTAEDGSLEYYTIFSFSYQNRPVGKPIELQITGVGTEQKPYLVRGEWTLKWTLSGTTESRIAEHNIPIGDSDITLLETEITPISIVGIFVIDDPDDIYLDIYSTAASEAVDSLFVGYRTKDGTIHITAPKRSGITSVEHSAGVHGVDKKYADYDITNDAIIIRHQTLTNRILNPDDVDAFVFLKSNPENKALSELTEENFYIIPIR